MKRKPRTRRSDPGQPSGDDQQSLSSSVRAGVAWSMASNLLMRLASIVITAVVAHILDPHDFGVFAVAQTAYIIVSALGELGVSSCLIRADLNIDDLAPTMATISIGSSIILAAVMVVFAEPIAYILGSTHAANPIRVMAIAVVLAGVFAVPGAQLTRDFKQNRLFLANVLGFVPSNVILVFLAYAGDGAMSLAWSRVAGQLIVGCILIVSTQKNYLPGLARNALSLLARFGIPLASANFVNFILLNVDYALIGHLLGATDLGVYVLAFNVASWSASLLGPVINNVSMPAFSRVRGDPELLHAAMVAAIRAVCIVVMPICALTIAVAGPLISVLYGPKWAAAEHVLPVLSVYGAISIVCVLIANMISGLGRGRILLAVQLLWLATLAPAMVLGVKQDGVVGAAIAHVLVVGPIVLPVYLFALRRATRVSILAFARVAVPPALTASMSGLAAWALSHEFRNSYLSLAAGLTVGAGIYAVLMAPQAVQLLASHRIPRVFESHLRHYVAFLAGIGLAEVRRPRHAFSRGLSGDITPSMHVRQPTEDFPVLSPQLSYAADPGLRALELLISFSRPVPEISLDQPPSRGATPSGGVGSRY